MIYPHICRACQQTFYTKHGGGPPGGMYCHQPCEALPLPRKRGPVQHQRVCRLCKKQFTTTTRRKLCHNPCTRMPRRQATIRSCKTCRTEFQLRAQQTNRWYCQPSCRPPRQRPRVTRQCKGCGRDFPLRKNYSGQWYCHKPCVPPPYKRKHASRERDDSLAELQAWMAEERKHL